MAQRQSDPGDGEPNKAHRDIARWTLAVAVFTFFLVLVSGISDWFIYQQWSISAAAQKDTREQLRAFVGQVGGSVVYVQNQDHKITSLNAIPFFHNYGNTRTDWFHSWTSIHYFDGDAPPNSLDLTKSWDKVGVTDTIIGAGETVPQGPVSIWGADVDNLLSHKGIGLLWGHGEYADIFNPTTIHQIAYCLLIVEPPNASGAPAPSGQLPAQPELRPYRADCNYSR